MVNDRQETHLERFEQLASPVRHVTTHPPVYHEPITHKLVAVPADAQLAFAEHTQPISTMHIGDTADIGSDSTRCWRSDGSARVIFRPTTDRLYGGRLSITLYTSA